MSGKRIESEEQYHTSLSWLVKKAEEIEDPLLDPEEKEKQMKLYDYVAGEIRRYRSADNGLPVAELVEPKQQEKTVNLSDFLDE